ncbi:hypothetical protein EV210_111136 [Anaerospora hongkongensis]|uniref:Uncharacterized protein n=1 Tax=Anaerospora hongkongensis TaxID=244830 RepID=A0A4R1PYM6_9FIRM|nr:hypothetical protein [Anaerospora hongkongensis]TCL35670.1 hypothetical protein EV210_111136 [Anaerospora hongkongensis]
MKIIEKITRDGDTQIFEIIESRKELSSWLRDALWDNLYSQFKEPVFYDPDTTIAYYDRADKFHWVAEGETVKRPNVANISKLVSTNGGSTVVYGDVPIIYNDHYGDWETALD